MLREKLQQQQPQEKKEERKEAKQAKDESGTWRCLNTLAQSVVVILTANLTV